MPIHCLPDDVLVIIFELCAALEPPYLRSLGWIKIAHVDRRWRALILDLPLLWSRVVCSFSSEMFRETALIRALDLPLALYFPALWAYRLAAPKELVNRLLPRARIVSSDSDQCGSLRLTGRSLPLLEELDIDSVNEPGRPLHAPSLRHLVIHAIPWTISAENLQSLQIFLDCELEHFHPHIIHLPNLLETVPALKSLKLKVATRYRPLDPEDGIASAVHSIRRSLRGALTALDQGKAKVNLQHLAFMTVEADTRGSLHGQYAALLATMLWRSLSIPRMTEVHFTVSEQIQPTLELLEAMQTHILTREFDTLAITYRWPGLEFTFTHEVFEEDAGPCAFELPSCDRTSFMEAFRYFSGNIGEHLRTLRLSSLSLPGPDLHGHTGQATGTSTSYAEGYPLIECMEVHGPASLLTHVLGLYAFERLHTIILHAEQHDHHELTGLARELRARSAKLKRLVLRGRTAYSDETKFAREIHALRLVEVVEVVCDERDGLIERVRQPRIFKAGDGAARLRERRASAADGRGGSSKAINARRRTDFNAHPARITNADSGGTGGSEGRTTWH